MWRRRGEEIWATNFDTYAVDRNYFAPPPLFPEPMVRAAINASAAKYRLKS
jgi:hypothetical protein